MAENVTKNRPGVSFRLGKCEGGQSAIIRQNLLRREEGQKKVEAVGQPEVYDLPKKQKRKRDAQTNFGQIERQIKIIEEGRFERRSFLEEQVEKALDLIG